MNDFQREIVRITLGRIPWLLALAMALAAWAVAALWRQPGAGWLRLVLAVDLLSAGLLLGLVRRLRPTSRWAAIGVWSTVVLALGFMDAYYFLVAGAFGQNPVYILGTVLAGTFFLLPPRGFLPLLAGNHLLYCLSLSWLAGPDLPLLPILVENTTGAAVAALVSVILYRAQFREFGQRRALAMANGQLERRNRQLAALMSMTAHDLRSPLLSLRDLLALARRMPREQVDDVLDRAGEACGDLVDFVDRLLHMRAAEDMVDDPPPLAAHDLREPIRAAIARIVPRAAALGVLLHADLPPQPAIAVVHAPSVVQIIGNLLANAVRFSPAGATVTVALGQAGDIWTCDVADEGPGVADAARSSLFAKQPFRGDEGAGIGLFIVATLIQAMHGSVEYLPGRPRGAVFRVTFKS